MLLPSLPLNSITIISTFPCRSIRFKFKTRAIIKPLKSNPNDPPPPHKSSAVEDSLRVLEWDKVCDCVSSFAGTSLGREATKAQLWKLNQSFEESTSLLAETTAAVQMINFGGCGMDFSGINVRLVKSAIQHASRSLPVDGNEALAVASLLMLSEALQINVKAALKEDSDWYNRFMPLTELIMALYVNRALIKSIQQVIDEDGSVRDSASSNLKRSRDQVQLLEKKLFQLMDNLIRKESNETTSLEVSNVSGRWCIKSGINEPTTANGLLLSSGSGVGNLVEPLSAVPLNDELQQARALVAKAEDDVLLKLTEKVQMDLDDIRDLLNTIIKLDVITARAKYSLSFGGTCPELFSTEHKGGYYSAEPHFQGNMTAKDALSHPTQRKWILYLPKAYHPLLLQKHRKNLQKARKDVTEAMAEIRRLQWESMTGKDPDAHIKFLKMQVTKLEEAHPVPVDFFVGTKTRVLIITGPNTGGKTICLKTVGLATMMAKSGLYVLSSEPVRIPWFDFIFADIGDEQSLSQSLSTFSGHLRQISAIQAQSTSKSLVLLDEVGAGTNPLEGAALGMSLLESFAEAGCLLTVATTHQGELKTLKYSNDAFENACMEFDEVNMKPTYQILWGVPGRSNAINIAKRLGVPDAVLDNARELYGTASAEIDEVIINMEQFKQDFQEHIHEAKHYLAVSRDLHKNLLVAKQKIVEHEITQRYRKLKEISEVAAAARSALHKRLRLIRASATQPSKCKPLAHSQQNTVAHTQHATTDVTQHSLADKSAITVKDLKQSPSEKRISLPMVGDLVNVSSLGKTAMVLNVDASKEEVVVQVNNLKLRLKLSDLQT